MGNGVDPLANVACTVLPSISVPLEGCKNSAHLLKQEFYLFRILARARGRHHPTLRAVVHMLSSAISSEAYVPSSPASILSAKTPMFVVQIRDGRRLPSESLISASDNLQTSSTFSTGKVSFQSGITDGSENVRVHRISCGCSSVAFLYLHPLLRQEQVRSNNKAATV